MLVLLPPREVKKDDIALAEVVDGAEDGNILAYRPGEGEEEAIVLPEESHFQLLPELRPAVAQHIHLSGPSGCGKSTWAGDFAETWRRYHPDGRVIVVSADKEDDPAIQLRGKDLRIGVDELGEDSLDEIEKAANKKPILWIFDDVEGVRGEDAKNLDRFRQAVQERGRRKGWNSIAIFHKAANYNTTKSTLVEATAFVFFPEAVRRNHLYALNEYAGIPEAAVTAMKRKPGIWGRSVVGLVSHPQVLIGARAAAPTDVVANLATAVAKADAKRVADRLR